MTIAVVPVQLKLWEPCWWDFVALASDICRRHNLGEEPTTATLLNQNNLWLHPQCLPLSPQINVAITHHQGNFFQQPDHYRKPQPSKTQSDGAQSQQIHIFASKSHNLEMFQSKVEKNVEKEKKSNVESRSRCWANCKLWLSLVVVILSLAFVPLPQNQGSADGFLWLP